jgi:hypothetical protein
MAVTTLTPQQIADKWASNLSNSTTSITAGVNGVTQAPGAKAAAAADFWLQRVTQSKAKFATNVAKVSLQDWKDAMINIGVPRVASGAQANKPKMVAFMTKFLPYVKAGVDALPPKGDLAANIQRAVAMMQHNAAFTG